MPANGRAHLVDPTQLCLIDVDRITVPPDYHREDLGDVDPLGEDLKDIGVLQDIVTDENLELLGGLRRLTAAKKKCLLRVPVKRIKCADDPVLKAQIRQSLDLHNKPLSKKEKDAAADKIRVGVEQQAAARKAATQAKPGVGKVGGAGSPKLGEPKKPAKNRSGETNRIVGRAVGKSHETVRKREAVLQSGYPVIIAEMKETGKIDPAYKKVIELQKKKEPPPAGQWAKKMADELRRMGKALDMMETFRQKKASESDPKAVALELRLVHLSAALAEAAEVLQ